MASPQRATNRNALRRAWLMAVAAVLLAAAPERLLAGAEDNPPRQLAVPPQPGSSAGADDPCRPENPLTDFVLRRELCAAGVKLGVTETSEVLANLTGGLHRGAIYEGLTDLNLGIDLRPSLHLRGNLFARAYQIHGRGLTPTIGSLNAISGIEAEATTRLVELWYEQHFDYWRLRIGEQTITTEFLSPASGRLFVSSGFGWPTLLQLNLPSGGPGALVGTPAVRLRVDPQEGLTFFLALFNADPTGAGVGGSQLRDASGTAFRTSDGAFLIGESRYNPESSDRNGTYRLGGWWNSERFRDLHLDTNRLPLANSGSNGRPLQHQGDFSLYAILDQPLFTNEAEHTELAVLARAMGAPGDRNLIDFYADAGLVYKGPFERVDDQAGLAIGYARVGGAARGLDADIARLTGQFHPVRSGETVLELTYRYQLTGWWQLQPDFQYVFNPGGGCQHERAGPAGRRCRDPRAAHRDLVLRCRRSGATPELCDMLDLTNRKQCRRGPRCQASGRDLGGFRPRAARDAAQSVAAARADRVRAVLDRRVRRLGRHPRLRL
jgi:porin